MIEQRLMQSPVSAHAVFRELYAIAKDKTRTGATYLLQLISVSPPYRHQLRKKFHGPVLRDISEQVWVPWPDGRKYRWSKAAWKEHLRDLFLPPVPQEYTTRHGEIKVRMVKQSTESISDDEFAEFLLKAEAYAVVDLGVVFTEQEDEKPWQP